MITEYKDREQRILDAALDLILHYGYDKTTVSEIATKAGVSKGAIYLHYASKDDLFEALMWREMWAYADEMDMYLKDEEQAWSFVGMYRKALVVVSKSPFMSAMLRGDERVFGNFMKRKVLEMGAIKRPYQGELLKLMQEAGTIRADLDIEASTYLLNVINHGFIVAQDALADENRPPMEKVVEALGDMLDRYLLPEDGGNQDAGRQIMLHISQAIREKFEERMNIEKEE